MLSFYLVSSEQEAFWKTFHSSQKKWASSIIAFFFISEVNVNIYFSTTLSLQMLLFCLQNLLEFNWIYSYRYQWNASLSLSAAHLKAWLRWSCMPNSWEGAIFLMFHALCCWFWPQTYLLTSSVQHTCFENASDFSRCSWANFSCWILWWKQQIIYNDSSIRRPQLGRCGQKGEHCLYFSCLGISL